MRKAWADASRVAEVRSAARSWRDAGAIGADTLEAIEAAYPDDRPPTASAWRILIFTLTSVALNAVFLASSVVTHRGAGALLLFGVLLVGLAEALRRSPFGGNGSAAAASFWAAVYVIAGTGAYVLPGRGGSTTRALTACLLVASLAFAAACWRWGYDAYGVFATAPLFVLIAQFPGARLWWVALGTLLAGAAYGQLDRARLAPPHRRAFAGVFVVSALALYVAANRYSVEERLIEAMWGPATPTAPASVALRALSDAATALLPLLFIAWGIRSRRALVLDVGLVFAALSLATLRYFVHLASPWVVLLACGSALVLGALWLNRFLRRAPNGERAGFTASALFRPAGAGGLATAAVVAGLSPHAAVAPERPGGGLSPGGGQFGGGGATGSF